MTPDTPIATPVARGGQQGIIGAAIVTVVLYFANVEPPPAVVGALVVLVSGLVALVQNFAESRGHKVLPALGKDVPAG